MTKREQTRGVGYFAIGIERGKTPANLGTLWRSAVCLGAAYVFTVGERYGPEAADTVKSWRHIPCVSYPTLDDLLACRPYDVPLVGVEMSESARTLADYVHPERAVYLLGAEDNGLSARALKACQSVVSISSRYCLNVAVAGSVLMYDRQSKETRMPVERLVAS